ncbi:MAG: hypothetical protein GQ558_04840, partial [Thermoplasmata archaeon]|nr:hypothetical protein [Thermoplasmata archaeon]
MTTSPPVEVEGDVGAGDMEGDDHHWYLRLTSSLYIATFAVRVGFAIIFIALPL